MTVQPDGSGTVTESFLVGKAALEQIKQIHASLAAAGVAPGSAVWPRLYSLAAGFLGAGVTNASKPLELMNEQKLRADAAKMGEGVTFVTAKKLANDFGEGYTVTYAFKDISKLKLKSDTLPEPEESAGLSNPDSETEFITFDFKKGDAAELTVHTTAKSTGAATEPKEPKDPFPPGADDAVLREMGRLCKDMRVILAIQVAGKIEKTDAEYVEGPKVTLLEVDFNQLLIDPAKARAVIAGDPLSPRGRKNVRKLAHSIPGLKAELKDTVKITFK